MCHSIISRDSQQKIIICLVVVILNCCTLTTDEMSNGVCVPSGPSLVRIPSRASTVLDLLVPGRQEQFPVTRNLLKFSNICVLPLPLSYTTPCMRHHTPPYTIRCRLCCCRYYAPPCTTIHRNPSQYTSVYTTLHHPTPPYTTIHHPTPPYTTTHTTT